MRLRLLVFGLFLVFALENCRSDKYMPDTCFQNDILPIFVTKCAVSGCHDGGKESEGYTLNTYAGIMKGISPKHPLRSEIYSAISGKNPEMPPKDHPQLSKHEVDQIKSWIQFGANNTINCSGACDTTNFSYSAGVAPILSKWCAGCHATANAGNLNVSLIDYNSVKAEALNTRLMGSINQLPGYSPMPKNIGKISDCDIRILQKWIGAGCPNN